MRYAIAAMLVIVPMLAAHADRWTVNGEGRYGCKTFDDVAQLKLMAAIKSAFEIALLDKYQSGACMEMTSGEAVTKIENASKGNLTVLKVRRADGSEIYVELQFVRQAI